ncbi:MAG: hypothetical protein SynsKO_18470 [Synoicihabitans sp.]
MGKYELHYASDLILGVLEGLGEAAMAGSRVIKSRYRRSRRPAHLPTRQPGEATPMWNALVENLRLELIEYGNKARLARYLGVPRQRVHNFIKDESRMPDAETTLRLLHWLIERRAGREPDL